MYILVREFVPLSFAMVVVSHASLGWYLKYQNTPEVIEWLKGSFYKVNDSEFEKAKQFEDSVIITESNLYNQEIAIAFKPREDWSKASFYN